MSINISAQHLILQEDLKEYVVSKLNDTVDKYVGTDIKSSIHFNTNNHHQIHCSILIHDGMGKNHQAIKSDGECNEVFSSFDVALGKLLKQLRKYKSKLKNNHNHRKLSESIEAKKYILDRNYIDAEDEQNLVKSDNKVIIAEHDHEILTLKVSEAVMKMDLENVPALMFTNATTGCINMIYRKKDDNIAWVDSKNVVA